MQFIRLFGSWEITFISKRTSKKPGNMDSGSREKIQRSGKIILGSWEMNQGSQRINHDPWEMNQGLRKINPDPGEMDPGSQKINPAPGEMDPGSQRINHDPGKMSRGSREINPGSGKRIQWLLKIFRRLTEAYWIQGISLPQGRNVMQYLREALANRQNVIQGKGHGFLMQGNDHSFLGTLPGCCPGIRSRFRIRNKDPAFRIIFTGPSLPGLNQ
jgi:hypothetical protein